MCSVLVIWVGLRQVPVAAEDRATTGGHQLAGGVNDGGEAGMGTG